MPDAGAAQAGPAAALGRHFVAYVEVCKPKVVAAIVFTAVVGMFLAVPGMVPLDILLATTAGIGLGAAAGAAFNHAVERRIDAVMARTRNRPVVSGVLASGSVTVFACILAAGSAAVLLTWVNWLSAALTLISTTAYAVGLYRLAQARHSAEHRHRRGGRRNAAGHRVDRGDGSGGPARPPPLSHRLCPGPLPTSGPSRSIGATSTRRPTCQCFR